MPDDSCGCADLADGRTALSTASGFIASDEAGAGPLHKQKILSGDYNETVRTTIYTGRPMRHLTQNTWIHSWISSLPQE